MSKLSATIRLAITFTGLSSVALVHGNSAEDFSWDVGVDTQVLSSKSDRSALEAGIDEASATVSASLRDLRDLLKGTPPKLRREALAYWEQNNASVLLSLEEARQTLHAQEAGLREEPLTKQFQPEVVPVGAPQAVQQRMELENQLGAERFNLQQQLTNLSPEARRDAIKAWEDENSLRTAQLKSLREQATATQSTSCDLPKFVPVTSSVELNGAEQSNLKRLNVLEESLWNLNASTRDLDPGHRREAIAEWDEAYGEELTSLRRMNP